jgi:hypothetical protein
VNLLFFLSHFYPHPAHPFLHTLALILPFTASQGKKYIGLVRGEVFVIRQQF